MNTDFFTGPFIFFIICSFTALIALKPYKEYTLIKNRPFTILTGSGIAVLICLLDYLLVNENTASTALEGPFCIVALILFSILVLKINIGKSIYCTAWAFLIMSPVSQILMPFVGLMDFDYWFIWVIVAILYLSVSGLVFFLVRRILLPHIKTAPGFRITKLKIVYAVLCLGLFLGFANYQFIFWLLGFEPDSPSRMITIFRITVGAVCLFLMFMQTNLEKQQMYEQERNIMEQLWFRQQTQYQLAQENIDLINRKCHDVKHQIAALRMLKSESEIDSHIHEMEHSIMIYDSVIKTGNPVLDTVLTEKSLYCEEHQIQMTCMVDGSMLEFVDPVDLYTMFGNALDNAIESVMKLEEKEKRVIHVSVFHENSLLMIRVKNYCDEKIKLQNGIPGTTKRDKGYHGYGLKSIEHIAEKYGGGIVVQLIHCYFALQILIPLNKTEVY